MKILLVFISLMQISYAITVEDKLKRIASSVEVKDGELILKMRVSVFYSDTPNSSLSIKRLRVGQTVTINKNFEYAEFYNRVFSIKLQRSEVSPKGHVLIEMNDPGPNRQATQQHIEFSILNDKIETSSKEIVYTVKEILDKIEGNRKKLKADLASESVKDKFKNIASVVEIKEGDILLTIKVKNFRYIESVDGDSIFYPLELGQKIIIKKGFEHASFQSEHYALSLTKESNNQYILEELKSDKPSSDAITIKTLLKFKILDDKIELVTAKKTKDIEAASSNWLILLGIGVFIILGFILYLKRKIPNS